MISRYSRKETANIWDLKSKFSYYLNVELAVIKAQVELGNFKPEIYENIKNTAKFDVKRIDEIERTVRHDVVAFLENVNENVGKKYSPYIHRGLTSSDVIDTAFALQIKDSSSIILKDIEEVLKVLYLLKDKHKETVCIGRSHGVHAEIMTFGLKMCSWIDILERQRDNFKHALSEISVGQISGPVGTYSNIDPKIEIITCDILGLKPARISTQIISRDRHAYFIQSLALIASVIEQFATEIRHLQRTEVMEVEEGFSKGQKGSSAMPHKKNPVLSENLCGLARVVRGNSIAAMENINLWHERDISHSSSERIIFPDSLILVDFMLDRFKNIMENLVVHEDNMRHNTEKFGGIIYSQKALLKLTEKGLKREDAYQLVQKNALDAFENNGNFKQNMINDTEIRKHLNDKEIEEIFDKSAFLKNISDIYAKF